MGSFNSSGAFPPSLLPAPKQQTLTTNYLNFTGDAAGGDPVNNFAQQYLPEIYEQEVERYGNRTVSSFLRMVGAEMPMSSDQVIWSEQNRLHIAYKGKAVSGNVITLGAGHVIVPKMTLVIKGSVGTVKGIVTSVNATTATVGLYSTGTVQAGAGASVDLFVYGSEFGKGTTGSTSNIQPDFTQFSNSPIIIKDKYAISGSDTAQIGWVEVATEAGDSGFLWYLKAEGETRLRFEDYLEMSVIEGEKAVATSGALAGGAKGTEGLFAAVKARGNVFDQYAGTLTDFDTILKQLDTQGAIEENMLFLDRNMNLAFDDMLAGINGGNAGAGSAYGVFDNSEEMALNLGFSGFRRGSYDFYKTDWKYLNDASTRGLSNSVSGVLVPAGTSTVYDQQLGTNIRRPFLHVRYRANQADDRRMKSWLTGSVGGAATSDLDAMEVHFLSERCLCVQAANNFVLFSNAA